MGQAEFEEDDMLHVRVGIDFALDHPRALMVGAEGLGYWVKGLAYSRKHELDGAIPKQAIAALGVPAHMLQSLLAAGLWLDDGDHYRIFNYEMFNQTKADIEHSKAKTKERVDKFRARNAVTHPVTNAVSPVSVSLSDSQEGEVQEGEATAQARYQQSYEAGIEAGKGSPYAMPGTQRGELHQGILKHGFVRGEKLRGERLQRWVTSQARQFSAWLSQQDPKTIGVYSSYGPRGWLKWLNETPIRASQVVNAHAAPKPPLVAPEPVKALREPPANDRSSEPNVVAPVADLVARLAAGWKP